MLWNRFLPDFSVYYYSSVLITQHRNPYINPQLFTQVNYPPTALMFLTPLSLLSLSIASKMWLLISIIIFILILRMLYSIKPIPLSFLSIIFTATVLSFPFKFTLGMGQINLLLLFMLVIFLKFMLSKKDFWASFFLSLSVAIKLFPIFFLLPIISNRRWKVLLITFGFLAIILVVAFFTIGSELNLYYFKNVLFPLIVKPSGAVYYNQSITGFVTRMHVPWIIAIISRITIVFVSLVISIKYKKYILSSFLTILNMILLVNNFTWQHHLVFLLLPYYFIISNKPTKKILFLTLVSYFLVAFNIKNPDLFSGTWYGNLILSHGFFGTLILWFLTPITKQR